MLSTTRRRENGAGCAGVAGEHTLGRQPLHLYGYLWSKPDFIVDDESGSFSFVLPDTVLFKQQKPVKWFFTSKQEKGKILTKSKKNVSVAQVLQAFSDTRHSSTLPPPADTDTEEQSIVATYTFPDRTPSGESVLVLEHLTPTGIHHLLTIRDKPSISVLQRFVPTRSGYNHTIQSVFTPDSCILRKCVNSHVVSDLGLSVAERTATFEADERFVKPRDMVNRELREKIEHFHLEISNHLQKLIGKPIARNVSYFKHGADGRIYLLWSTMLSFESGSLAFAKNLRLSLTHTDRLQLLVALASTSVPRSSYSIATNYDDRAGTGKCPACRKNVPYTMICFYVTFKAVIKTFESVPRDPLSEYHSCIPPLLESVLAPISEDRFQQLRRDRAFMYRTVRVCHNCANEINNAKRMEPRRNTELATVSSNNGQADKPIPLYMQSAHSIFWGKVEWDEAARSKCNDSCSSEACTKPSKVRRSRPSTTVLTTETNLNGLTRASLRRLLPESTVRAENIQGDEPKHCMHKLAEHLQLKFGGPSVRLALARTNIFPSTSTVSLDMLEWVCDQKLLAEVFAYWRDVSKTNGHTEGTSTMDLDALDAMLSVYVEHNQLRTLNVSERQSPRLQISKTISAFKAISSAPSVTSSLIHPVRPRCRRSRSSIVHRPTLNRRAQPDATAQVPSKPHRSTEVENEIEWAMKNLPHRDTLDFQISCGQHQLKRYLNGVLCGVRISAIHDSNGALALGVKAWPIEGEDHEFKDEAPADAMQATLPMTQILALVPHRACAKEAISVPCSAETLIEAVLNALTIRHGCLAVEISSGSALTKDERSVLDDALDR